MVDSDYEGSLIRVVDVDGNIVGENIVDAFGKCGLAVWGDDLTTEAKDGLFDEEAFSLLLNRTDDTSETTLSIDQLMSGDGLVYQTDSFIAVSVNIAGNMPLEFALRGAYPNPFNGKVTLEYSLDNDDLVSLSVYDLSGRQVGELFSGVGEAGIHRVVWNADNMATGVYFIRLTSASKTAVKKVTLLR